MNKKLLLILVGFSIILSGCTHLNKTDNPVNSVQDTTINDETISTEQPSETPTESSDSEMKNYTMSEVSVHNNSEDCWFVIDNSVYDVTNFIPNHPGGAMILKGCGKDASSLFYGVAKHQPKAVGLMNNFKIGILSE